MQVRKFEAKSMKEALDLVKKELGPEAIILHVKDNKKAFGLAGSGSIEVTAAASEKAIHKKKFTEAKLPMSMQSEMTSKSAKVQKAFIEKTVTKYQDQRVAQEKAEAAKNTIVRPKSLTKRRYIDISEDESVNTSAENDVLENFAPSKSYVLEDSANIAMNVLRAEDKNEDLTALKSELKTIHDSLAGIQSQKGHQYPGSEYDLPYEFSHIFEKLFDAGIDTKYIVEILSRAKGDLSPIEKKKKSLAEAWVAKYMMGRTKIVGSWMRGQMFGAEVNLFLGPNGVGKTSTLVKTAYHLSNVEKKKVVVFSCDQDKIGASEQLKIFCQIMGLPLEFFSNPQEFDAAFKKHSRAEAILVDYPGTNLKKTADIEKLRHLMPAPHIPRVTHLVLNAGLRDVDAYDFFRRYQQFGINSLVMTKLDECAHHGLLYNMQHFTDKPLYVFGTGSRVPEDIELATSERVVDLIFDITEKDKKQLVNQNEKGV